MLFVGCHLSTTGGFYKTVETAISIGANTFAFFTRNPRGSKAKDLDQQDIIKARGKMAEANFGKLVAHGSYTMNLCTAKPEDRAFAASLLEDDLRRMAYLPDNFYNFHPGSHVGQGSEAGIEYISQALKTAMAPNYPVTVLLEAMAGKGSEVGGTFHELKGIIDCVGRDDLGVCLDTCHIWDAGYPIKDRLDEVLEEFDRVIGLNRLKALHLNDSKNTVSSHKDRHACIGEGYLGVETFSAIVNHPVLKNLPMILETPNDLTGYAREIALLRNLEK